MLGESKKGKERSLVKSAQPSIQSGVEAIAAAEPRIVLSRKVKTLTKRADISAKWGTPVLFQARGQKIRTLDLC